MLCRQVAVIHSYLASPLYAFYIELSSGLNLLIKYFSFSFLAKIDIRHENLRMIPVSGHIATCSDKDPKYFMFPFYKMNCDSILARKEKEKYCINKFKPELNSI